MGGKSGGGGDTRVLFAAYIENAHYQMMNHYTQDSLTISVFEAINSTFNQSPYDITTVKAEDGFLGVSQVIGSRDALFDLFEDLMSNLNINTLWSDIYTSTVSGSEVDDAVASFSDILQDEIDTKTLPKMLAGYRDIGSVMSSTFIVGRTIISNTKLKAVTDFTAKLKLQQMEAARARWESTLNWNKTIVATYADVMKLFYSAKFDAENRQMEFAVKDELWNLSLFEYARSTLAALNGAAAAKPDLVPSQTAKSVSMAMAGASAGAMIGNAISKESGASWGAAAGGLLGLASSF